MYQTAGSKRSKIRGDPCFEFGLSFLPFSFCFFWRIFLSSVPGFPAELGTHTLTTPLGFLFWVSAYLLPLRCQTEHAITCRDPPGQQGLGVKFSHTTPYSVSSYNIQRKEGKPKIDDEYPTSPDKSFHIHHQNCNNQGSLQRIYCYKAIKRGFQDFDIEFPGYSIHSHI